MRRLLVLPAVCLTIACWGNYGPLMHRGQHGMGGNGLRPFICVGFAYFVVAVLVPVILLRMRGESGRWTLAGTAWSLAAGLVGALGAFGAILAFAFGGRPVYVMPLIFGGAPVVNTLVTMALSRSFRDAGLVFYAGVLLVALGGAGVLSFKPQKPTRAHHEPPPARGAEAHEGAHEGTADIGHSDAGNAEAPTTEATDGSQPWRIAAAVCVAALSWGSYGPVLHNGQMRMAGSRLRPFLCVGVAYFLTAVAAPWMLLTAMGDSGGIGAWMPDGRIDGILWSLAGGSAGAIGALGVILAFNAGGKPLLVMPLIFGGAPVMNTATTILAEGTGRWIGPPFLASLGLVIAGAVTVLVFAPRPRHVPTKPIA